MTDQLASMREMAQRLTAENALARHKEHLRARIEAGEEFAIPMPLSEIYDGSAFSPEKEALAANIIRQLARVYAMQPPVCAVTRLP